MQDIKFRRIYLSSLIKTVYLFCMKAKFLAIYITVGAAFLIVSLWVFLSGGKNARAIRCKYKLGGIILTAWAMLSVASCEGTPGMITCYDPVPPVYASLETKEGVTDFKAGDVLSFRIWDAHYEEFLIRIYALTEDTLLQSATFTPADPSLNEHQYDMTLEEFDYKGTAGIMVYGIYVDSEGRRLEIMLSDLIRINIL